MLGKNQKEIVVWLWWKSFSQPISPTSHLIPWTSAKIVQQMSLLSISPTHQFSIKVSYYGYLYLLITQTLMMNLIKQWGIFHNQHSFCTIFGPHHRPKISWNRTRLIHLFKSVKTVIPPSIPPGSVVLECDLALKSPGQATSNSLHSSGF